MSGKSQFAPCSCLYRPSLTLLLSLSIIPVAASGQSTTPAPKASAATRNTEGTKQPAAEVYTKVENPSALGLQIEVEATLMRGTPNDDGPVQGKVTSLTVGGKPLALVSGEIVNDNKGSWVVTKAYGRIRISGAYSGGIMFWLTPSQRMSLKAFSQTANSVTEAIKTGNLSKVKALIATKPDLIFSKDKFGDATLIVAVEYGQTSDWVPAMCEFLISQKADVNAKGVQGMTPLHWAAAVGLKGVAELLVKKNADVNARNDGGETPLGFATDNGHKDVADFLRQHGGQQ